jgi:hypothetical protein
LPITTSKSPQFKHRSALRRRADRDIIAIVENTTRNSNTKNEILSQIELPTSSSFRKPTEDYFHLPISASQHDKLIVPRRLFDY